MFVQILEWLGCRSERQRYEYDTNIGANNDASNTTIDILTSEMLVEIPCTTYCDITITLCGLFDEADDLQCAPETTQSYENHCRKTRNTPNDVHQYVVELSDAALELSDAALELSDTSH